MKALSLWEPWATAMSLDLKRNETRGWATSYKGLLAICAARRPMGEIERDIFDQHVLSLRPDAKIVYGAVLCVVELYGCARTSDCRGRLSATEYTLGDYSAGRWAWLTRGCVRLRESVPVIGRQGLFNLPLDVEAAVVKQMK